MAYLSGGSYFYRMMNYGESPNSYSYFFHTANSLRMNASFENLRSNNVYPREEATATTQAGAGVYSYTTLLYDTTTSKNIGNSTTSWSNAFINNVYVYSTSSFNNVPQYEGGLIYDFVFSIVSSFEITGLNLDESDFYLLEWDLSLPKSASGTTDFSVIFNGDSSGSYSYQRLISSYYASVNSMSATDVTSLTGAYLARDILWGADVRYSGKAFLFSNIKFGMRHVLSQSFRIGRKVSHRPGVLNFASTWDDSSSTITSLKFFVTANTGTVYFNTAGKNSSLRIWRL